MDARAAADVVGPLRGFMFDVDGTLVLGDRAGGNYEILPGAVHVLEALNDRRFPFVLLTNGSGRPPAEVAAKLRHVGLPVLDEQMLTPSSVAADYLARHKIERVLILGTSGVGQPLEERGLHILWPDDSKAREAEAVYVGWHPECGMRDIEVAARAIWGGAKFFAASDAPFFATREGRSIGYSHAIVAAIRSLTGKRVVVLGKPSQHAMRFVARKLGESTQHIGVVGDDPQIEIAMARRGGAIGFGVSTGVTAAESWAVQPLSRRPHRVLQTVGDLLTSESILLEA